MANRSSWPFVLACCVRRLAATAVLAFVCAAAAAVDAPARQPPRWDLLADVLFRHHGREQGAAPLIVTALAQDGQGFLWLGTQSGLARWDGYRLRTYVPDHSDPGALPDNFITALLTDRRGILWVGTSSGWVVRFDPASERFVAAQRAAGSAPLGMIYALADDGQGDILVGSASGLSRVQGDALHPLPIGSGPPSAGRVTALLVDRSGELWLGSDTGVLRRDRAGSGWQVIPLASGGGREPRVDCLLEDSNGSLWLGTHDHGVLVLDAARRSMHALPLHLPAQSTFHEYITSMAEVAPGRIWVASHGDGILDVDTRSGTTRLLRHEAMNPSSLTMNTVQAMLKDASGQIWVGTYEGLDSAGPLQAGFLTVQGGVHRDGIAASEVDAIAVGADGRIWAGLYNKGLDILDPWRGTIQHLPVGPPGSRDRLPDQPVLALTPAPDGRMVIGSDGGVYLASPDGRQVHAVLPEGRHARSGSNALAFADGVLWVGGLDDGLWRLDPHDAWKAAEVTGLTDKRIQTIQPEADGALWVGTMNGLSIVDGVSRRVRRIGVRTATQDGLSGGLSGSILRDAGGRMWIAVMGGGIDIIEGWSGDVPRLRHLGTRDGLPDANVDTLLMDRQGMIWASTDNGLARIDPHSLKVESFHRADGVGISVNFTHTGLRTEAGELLFGGTGGLTIVQPERVRSWDFRPPLVVTELRVGDRSVPAGRFNGSAPGRISAEVPAEHNKISIEFAALDYSEPASNRYAYLLEGFDRDWITVDAEHRTATYTNLPPGQYRLRLRGTNRVGTWFERPLPLTVVVAAFWYQTGWFAALAIVLVLAALYLLVRWRLAFLEHRRRELEAEVGRKTEALRAANAELEARYRELGDQAGSLAQQRDELAAYRNRAESEAEVASFLLSRLTRADRLDDPGVAYFWLPAEAFSGDVIAAGRSAEGDLYGMLADATGHGLAAAINLIPLTSAFYAMAAKGFDLRSIGEQLNKVVKDYSLADRFVAVTLVRIDASESRLDVLNAGNPAAVLLDGTGRIVREFRSGSVPLGILPRPAFQPQVETHRLAADERLAVFSDGLVEASNQAGDPFGRDGICAALRTQPAQRDPVAGIRRALYAHLGEAAPADDVSLLVLGASGGGRGLTGEIEDVHPRPAAVVSDPTWVMEGMGHVGTSAVPMFDHGET